MGETNGNDKTDGDMTGNKPELSNSKSNSKEYSKTPLDDVDADLPLVDDDQNNEQKNEQKNDKNTNDNNHLNVNDINGINGVNDEDGIDLNNTLFAGSKLMKSSFVDNYQKSLRHEVFTYNDINELNPDHPAYNDSNMNSAEEEKVNDDKV